MENKKKWTTLEILKWTTEFFKTREIEGPRASAEILLACTLGLKRLDLYLNYDQPLEKHELADFKKSIQRRLKFEPVAYIIGLREFWSRKLIVTQDVLIPRPETEVLVQAGHEILSKKEGQQVLELGVGSGAVSIALAGECPAHLYTATDYSIRAINVANQNTRHHNLAKNIKLVCADWFKPFKQVPFYDVIISNPPYIKTRDMENLQPEIRLHEPATALHGGYDGLDALGHIIQTAHFYLREHGYLVLEIGYDQQASVTSLAAANYTDITFIQDYNGYHRVVRMVKK